jgi:hypothetical protein
MLARWFVPTHASPLGATLVYCDNVSAVYLSNNLVEHQRTRHVEIDLHFVRRLVALIDVHVPTTSQFVDIFTKGLPCSVFSRTFGPVLTSIVAKF